MREYFIKKIFISGLLISFIVSCTAGSARFPEPRDQSYNRKIFYEITHDELWGIVTDVLRQQDIEILRYSKEKSRILTHYIVGETKVYPGLFSGLATTTRYRYDINLGKIKANQTSLIIKTKIQAKSSMMGTSDWHDISENNRDLCEQLEDWLYEKIKDYFKLVQGRQHFRFTAVYATTGSS